MPTAFTKEDGQIVWVSHVPDWETNPEGAFYWSEAMAREGERAYENRTGIKVESDVMLGQLLESDRAGWHATLRWNRAFISVHMSESLRWADHKERQWRKKHWGIADPYLSESPAPTIPGKRHPFSPELKDQVWLKTNGHCSYCGLPLLPFTNFTIDHVHPVVDGGTDDFGNLVPCCKTCNSRKHAMPVETFRMRCGGGLFWIERNGGTL